MGSRATPFHRIAAVVLGLIALVAVAMPLVMPAPAQAQEWYGSRRVAPRQPPSFNPFGFFNPSPSPYYERPAPRSPEYRPRHRAPEPRAPVESSRAPPQQKRDGTPTTQVLVLGDALADWLAYGIEEAYEDETDIGVIRKNRINTGLIKPEARDAYDWVQQARDILAAEKADFVVIMLGLSDRQPFRERPPPKPPSQPGAPPSIIAETPAGPTMHEFRSEKWAELYGKRIDEMIAVLKSKGVPVLWVGLPSIRGARSKADAIYLNDLFRSHAEKAGITYVDVWDGFVDDNGDFALFGPDYDGQVRRLRSHDGVHFTKAGALKLGHYVERELHRLIQVRTAPVAVVPPEPTRPGGPAPRPDAGPVVPLNAASVETDGLAGGGAGRTPTPDPNVSRVLVKGESLAALPGRADDFTWPRRDGAPNADDVIPIVQSAPPPVRTTAPAPDIKKTPAPKRPGQAAANPSQKQAR